ncbi:MAG TPA: VOC family protein [Gemmatimonadales bacterium]|jgi:catechol 2,3-dioxygenase-like lactoylglutathione lyase family enzyme
MTARFRPGLGCVLLPILALVLAVPAGGQLVSGVGPIGMSVSDLDRSIAFYTGVLSFQVVADTEVVGSPYERLTGVFGARIRVARLRLGREEIELTQYLAPEGRPAPADTRSNDRWFQHIAIVVSDMDSAYRMLRRARVRHASTGPQLLPAWNPAAGGIRAFYFKDPDGHHLELIRFPRGKGDPRWQSDAAGAGQRGLFLGIDHTAIVVGDTERSLGFYRDRLGLTVAGESRNHGTEQEHLNIVEGARLRITSLRAGSGPGIEFLEYLEPRDGRSFPTDARPNDLIHWHTTLVVAPSSAAMHQLADSAPARFSRGVADLPDRALGFSRGVMLRDPDGHALLVVDP